ncbi:hypothetical protein R9X47_24680 [Wukongibacter baidiensis]|uniref:hypothetical protein n=1 Tax=Wukongibacter baidiensis TaxID=1723361 RepID=UPI003D7F9333
MKKILNLGVVLVLVLALLAGCAGSKPADQPAEDQQENKEAAQTEEPKEEAKYEDGVYFAKEDGFSENSGWKDVVTIEVKDGKIATVQWNGAHKNGGVDKVTASEEGKYPMVEKGGAKAPWHEQAEKVEAYLIDTQDTNAIEYKDNEGHTDVISGATMKVKGFFGLAEKALADGPVDKGQYKDGAYHAEESEFNAETGWKATVDLTVINGNIVAANWNGIHKDGGSDKKTLSVEGKYPMVEKAGAKAPWHEQAAVVEAYLLENQDPTTIEYKDDKGHTDAISGVSIAVSPLFKLAEEALAEAK